MEKQNPKHVLVLVVVRCGCACGGGVCGCGGCVGVGVGVGVVVVVVAAAIVFVCLLHPLDPQTPGQAEVLHWVQIRHWKNTRKHRKTKTLRPTKVLSAKPQLKSQEQNPPRVFTQNHPHWFPARFGVWGLILFCKRNPTKMMKIISKKPIRV